MYIWRVWVSKDNIHCLFISHGCVFFNVSGRIVEHKPLQGCKPGHLLQGSAFPVFQWVCTSVPLCEYVCVCVCLAAPIQNHGHLHPEGTRSQIFFCQPKCIWTICRQQMSPLQSTAHSFYKRWLWSGRQGSHCLCTITTQSIAVITCDESSYSTRVWLSVTSITTGITGSVFAFDI